METNTNLNKKRTYREISEDLVAARKKVGIETLYSLKGTCRFCGRERIENVSKDEYFSVVQLTCKCGSSMSTTTIPPQKAILDVEEQIKNLIERWGPEQL